MMSMEGPTKVGSFYCCWLWSLFSCNMVVRLLACGIQPVSSSSKLLERSSKVIYLHRRRAISHCPSQESASLHLRILSDSWRILFTINQFDSSFFVPL